MRTKELVEKIKEEFEKECIIQSDSDDNLSRFHLVFVSGVDNTEIQTLSVDVIESQLNGLIKIILEDVASIEIQPHLFEFKYYYEIISEFINDNIQYELRKV